MTNKPSSESTSSNGTTTTSAAGATATETTTTTTTATAAGAEAATANAPNNNNNNTTTTTATSENNNNNHVEPRRDDSNKIIAVAAPAAPVPLGQETGGAGARADEPTTQLLLVQPAAQDQNQNQQQEVAAQEGRAPSDQNEQDTQASTITANSNTNQRRPEQQQQLGVKSETQASDGNNNRSEDADQPDQARRATEGGGGNVDVKREAADQQGAEASQPMSEQSCELEPAAEATSCKPTEQDVSAATTTTLVAGSDEQQPEYTMLKPVTPTGGQHHHHHQQQQQHQQQQANAQLIQQQHHSTTTTTATILTDLDAAEGGAHGTNTSGSHEQHGIKIEQAAVRSPAGPLTELAPAATATTPTTTTFSELTSVNPVTIQHHPMQQQPQFVVQHHPHPQQQHLVVASANQAPGAESSSGHLVGDVQLQQEHHQLHQPHQMGYATHPAAAAVGGPHFQLSNAGHLQQQQQTLTPLGESGLSSSNFAADQASGGREGVGVPAAALPAGNASQQRFQTTGPPSASSVTSSGGMTTPTGAGGAGGPGSGSTAGGSTTGGGGGKRRSWSQMNRNVNKTEIAKVYSQYGFRCYLEAPISTCRRKEEDRITYINKGEFYGLTLDYVPDPGRPLRSSIVKAVVMLVFREDKSAEDDLKSWQFWHSRQHSAKQRILDVDNKNHVNVINQIEEVSLNAIAFYWNPFETRQAKLNIAIQCLSTDFSNQKGVKGLPLNLQVDIYDLFTETSTPVYRAYSTLLSYCDKGAQRRSRDEERRALKRKLADQSSGSTLSTSSQASAGSGGANSTASSQAAATTGKKFEDLYHKPCDRTEFYAMADLIKAPTLYSPTEAEALGLAAAGAISDTNSNSGAGGVNAVAGTPGAIKQPMSQASGVSITPISATTPIPASGPIVAIQPDGSQQALVGAGGAGLLPSVAAYSQQSQVPGQQLMGAGPTRVGLPMGGANQAQFGGPVAGLAYGSSSSQGLMAAGDYMGQPVVGGPASGQMIATLNPAQQQQTGVMSQQQQHLATNQQQQQQQQHQSALGQSPSIQQQQQHHQHHHQQQHHQQHQHQQHQHHYHPMTSNASIQPSYGILQGSGGDSSQQQQQQQQQYAILQPSLGMTVQHSPSNPSSHLHGHSHQHAHQQQQLMSTPTSHGSMNSMMDPSRSQQMHQGSAMMMAGGGGPGMMTSQQQQQQHQMQAQHGQYMTGGQAMGQPAANNLANLTTPTSMGGQQQQQLQAPYAKRAKMYPGERVLIYAKQADEKDFYPLHLSPPSLSGLVYAIEQKYKIDSTKVANIYKKSKKGIRVQMDDEMIRHYCNEDMVQLEVIQTSDSRLEITLVEL